MSYQIDYSELKNILEANSNGRKVTDAQAKRIGDFLLKLYQKV